MARKSSVWFRAGRGWYTTVSGKQIPLGPKAIDAQTAHAALEALLRAAQQPALEPQPPPQVSTHPVTAEILENWSAKVEAWLQHKTALKLKAKTLKAYRWNLERWLAKFGLARASEITAEAVEEHSHTFAWGVNQRGYYLRIVQGFLKWCGLSLSVPCPGHQSAGAQRVIPEELHNRAVALARGDVGAILQFMWHTGCRPCEACSLTFACVDVASGTARPKEHKTAKKGKTRILYLSERALAVVAIQRQKYATDGPVFRTRYGLAYLTSGLTATLVRMNRKHLGGGVTSYGYRHSYATRALELGLPDTHVAALLGHSSTKMIHAHYSHISENARLLKAAAARV